MNQGDYRELYGRICREWNIAEETVKQAEQVCNEVIIPSITELRYAGRRLVQALELMHSDGDPAKIEALLNDALFDCHRARHDAVDAATSQMALVADLAAKKLGYNAILAAFPQFAAFAADVANVRAQIAKTRGSAATRDDIYTAIENVALPALVAHFVALKTAEPMMVAIARKERIILALSIGGGIIGAILGAIGAYPVIAGWF